MHDLIEPIDIKVDQIYNLACPASPRHYQKNSIYTLKTNLLGTLNMLELALNYNAMLFQASTSEIYGDPEVHPQTEKYWGHVNPVGIRSCYDEGKRAAETMCFDYMRTKNISVKVARIFNTYGPRMDIDDGRVVSNFITQALRGEDITIFGDGTQTRSFCFVSDLIKGWIKFMESPSDVPGPINLGSTAELTVNELAKKIITLTESKSKVVYEPMPLDDPKQRQPDISNAKRMLGWTPEVSIEEGLEKTINYFDSLLKSATE